MEHKYIYRFIGFEAFVNLVQTNSLVLVKPELWDDPYENFVSSKIKTDEGKKELISILKEFSKEINVQNISGMLYGLIWCVNSWYCQCWTKHEESDALWRIYNYSNKAIRIKTSIDKICKLDESIIVKNIIYKNELSMKNILNEVCSIDGRKADVFLYDTLMYKRKAFEHEGEVRLLKSYNYDFEVLYNIGTKIKDKLYWGVDVSNEQYYKLMDELIESFSNIKQNDCITVDIQQASQFIDSVMVHPLAPDWFDNTVSRYCEINNLKYEGKSKLYYFQ